MQTVGACRPFAADVETWQSESVGGDWLDVALLHFFFYLRRCSLDEQIRFLSSLSCSDVKPRREDF